MDCHVAYLYRNSFPLCFFCSSDKVALLWFMFRAIDVLFPRLMLAVVIAIKAFKTH